MHYRTLYVLYDSICIIHIIYGCLGPLGGTVIQGKRHYYWCLYQKIGQLIVVVLWSEGRSRRIDRHVPQHSGFLQHQFNLRMQAKSADVHVPLLESWISGCSGRTSMATVKSKLVSEYCLWSAYAIVFSPLCTFCQKFHPLGCCLGYPALLIERFPWNILKLAILTVMSRTSLLFFNFLIHGFRVPHDNANIPVYEISASHGPLGVWTCLAESRWLRICCRIDCKVNCSLPGIRNHCTSWNSWSPGRGWFPPACWKQPTFQPAFHGVPYDILCLWMVYGL